MSDSDSGKYVVSVRRKPMASSAYNRRVVSSPVNRSINRPVASVTKQQQVAVVSRQTAAEIKNEAIEKAMASAAKVETKTKKKSKIPHIHFGWKRTLLALGCTAVAIFAIVYFVNLNAPNVSLKVLAMQVGIEASYPAYVPRDYSLSDITSENGKIVLNFKNTSTGDAFSLTEENSAWDSNALLNNYVKNEYGESYTVIKEQGLTIYVSDNGATWVNRGVFYNLQTGYGTLTKKQIKTIAVSL